MMATKIDGVVPVIPIPFLEDESIDELSLRKTVDHVAGQDLPAMCLPAYGSEFYKLTDVERHHVVEIAIEANAGRMMVIAQANHGSSKIAAQVAVDYQQMGADLISFALPRQFAASQLDLLDYSAQICNAVDVPVMIQDFNPSGQTIDAQFIADLADRCDNFRYVKLEEPMIVNKLLRIRDRMGDRIGVLEGWGGYYMLEAIPAGICGIMPGVPIAPLLGQVYQACRDGRMELALELFEKLLPFINYTLQDIELFLQVEKRLLVKLGLFETPLCRMLTYRPSATENHHIDQLVNHVAGMVELNQSELNSTC
jgi:2-keto-3-deoxy-L-arabinonate dehydratase